MLIVAGGGALDASLEVTLLSSMLQAPVMSYRRGRGVLDDRDPFSVNLPIGRDLWGEADAVLAVGTRLHYPVTQWGIDRSLQIVSVDADKNAHARLHKPSAALTGALGRGRSASRSVTPSPCTGVCCRSKALRCVFIRPSCTTRSTAPITSCS